MVGWVGRKLGKAVLSRTNRESQGPWVGKKLVGF